MGWNSLYDEFTVEFRECELEEHNEQLKREVITEFSVRLKNKFPLSVENERIWNGINEVAREMKDDRN